MSIFYGQYFKGHTVFMARQHVEELHDLDPDIRALHLDEMARVSEAIFKVHQPRKMNYAALGNNASHLHWSLIPRYKDDAQPTKSPWEDEGFWTAVWDPAGRDNHPSRAYVDELVAEIEAAGVVVEQRFPAFDDLAVGR
ncbi:MAG TPA: HIT domain-containing protein [Acidimicrobiales bacterium]|nr:HIT domain-containing protein [Acidimicrobiales bacterium]